MAHEFPARTLIFTFGLPLFALLQVINGILYNGSVLLIGAFGALMVAYSVQITRYHIARFRREKLVRGWIDHR